MIKEYFSLLKQYKEKYGVHTLLFMQVGSFFEVYSKSMEDVDMVHFTTICDLKIANKPLGKDKLYMAGFRDYIIDKYIQKMNQHSDYTIVVYDQKEENGKIIRECCGVFSPGSSFHESEQLSNHITCIWIHKTKKIFKECYIFGICTMDSFTSSLYINEYELPYYHNPTTYDEIEKHISIYNPIELIIIHNIEHENIKSILNFIHHKSRKVQLISTLEENPISKQAQKCEEQCYQQELIEHFYPHLEYNHMKSYLFEHIISFQCLCFLLNYMEQHNPDLTKHLNEPHIENESKRLILANHSLKQLNILNNEQSEHEKYSSIMSLFNICKTKMGKRLFQYHLVHPIKDSSILEQSYTFTEHMINKDYDWNHSLSSIKDVEKILRKKILKKCCPLDYHHIYEFCEHLENIISNIDKTLEDYFDTRQMNIYIQEIKHTINSFFDLSLLSQLNHCQFDKENVDLLILKGNDFLLDEKIQQKLESKDKLNSLIDFMDKTYLSLDKKTKNNVIKIHETTSGVSLQITKRRSVILNKYLKTLGTTKLYFDSSYTHKKECFEIEPSEIVFFDYNATTQVMGGQIIDTYTKQLYDDCSTFYKYFSEVYHKFHDKISYDSLYFLIEKVQQMDLLQCKKNIAIEFQLSKPIIKESQQSYLNIKELRHPLIEKLEQNELYVSNDIELGGKNSGMLLFGTNAVGKTSLIKSIGICVLMAQCGLYVPCKEMVYSPYEYIFTRIIGNDNIFKGLSTFGVEMSELRVILKHCNENSLILGDELCSGTEIDSALSIFVSSLEKMYKENSSFVFATHFHCIQHFEELKKMEHIQKKHLSVQYNHEMKTLIYNRKLSDGPGASIYGLEVCKSLNLPNEFIERAYEIRNKYDDHQHNILDFKPSKYNKDKLRGLCEFCNESISEEIHHLKYQKDFKDNQLHNKANLSGICKSCHDKIHSLNLVYERKKTLNGYKIILSKN